MCDPKSAALRSIWGILSAFNISSSVTLYDYLKPHKKRNRIKLWQGTGSRIPNKINAESRKFPPVGFRRVFQEKAAERKAKGNAKSEKATAK